MSTSTSAAAGSPWTGFICDFGGPTAPPGWLSCDGSAVSRTDYAALFAAIGTYWGVGDGSTTFNLPPLNNNGAFRRGMGGGSGGLGVYQGSQNLSHQHVVYEADGSVGSSTTAKNNQGGNYNTPLTGASGGSEARPVNYGVNTCIHI